MKLLVNRSPVAYNHLSIASESKNDSNLELAARVNDLEKIISKQNVLIEECQANSKLLLEENLDLKVKLDKALCGIEGLQCAHGNSSLSALADGSTHANNVINQPQSSWSSPSTAGAGSGSDCSEPCEVIINGALKKDSEITDETAVGVAFAVLGTVASGL